MPPFSVGVGVQGVGRDSEILNWLFRENSEATSILFMQGDIEEMRWQRAHEWKGKAYLRWYHPDSMEKTGAERAREVVAWLWENDRDGTLGIAGIIPANELNADVEHGGAWGGLSNRIISHLWRSGHWYQINGTWQYAGWPGDERVALKAGEHVRLGAYLPFGFSWHSKEAYERITVWDCEFFEEFQVLDKLRDYPLMLSPLSPGGNPPGTPPESEYEIRKPALDRYKLRPVHVYGPLDDEWRGTLRLKRIIAKMEEVSPGGKYDVSEVNAVKYIDFLKFAKAQGVKDNQWFLFVGNSEHSALDLGRNNDLGKLKEYIEANREEEPVPTDHVRAWLSDMWTRAGVSPDKQQKDTVFWWAVRRSKSHGQVFVPQPTADGVYQNWSESERYVVCYTYPQPLYFEKGVWDPILPGFPPP